jgi:hypothetical protein
MSGWVRTGVGGWGGKVRGEAVTKDRGVWGEG